MTGAAVPAARRQLAALSARYRPPATVPRLAPGGAGTMTAWLIIAGASVGAALLTAVGNLATSEVQGRLELLPRAILWFAARWLEPTQRVTVYEEE
jgi:hypothetical protein